MSTHLPGFDNWLTTQPTEEDIEPSERNLKEAQRELGPYSSEEEVWNLACMLAQREADASREAAEEHAAESSREDMEDRYGDGP
jgi:hypothetical protein